ncbi:MAG: zinc metalloprotease HtpX [Pseudomonadota bacterium]
MNATKTMLLLAALTALFGGVGWLIAGFGGAIIALIVAFGMNALAWWNSDKLLLRMHHAEPVTRQSAPALLEMVARLAGRAGLPMPAVYIIRAAQPNAFATGRGPQNAAIAVTTGLMEGLSREELAGVVAHELAHIRNRDTLIMTVAATVAGAIALLSQFGFLFSRGRDRNPLALLGVVLAVVLAPLAALLIQMLISRTREYAADRAGAEICGQPLWLAAALDRIAGASRQNTMKTAENNPASAHIFIVNPLAGRRFDGLFSTHPNPANRIAALQQMARDMGSTQPSTAPPPAASQSASHTGSSKTSTARSPAFGMRRRRIRGPWS